MKLRSCYLRQHILYSFVGTHHQVYTKGLLLAYRPACAVADAVESLYVQGRTQKKFMAGTKLDKKMSRAHIYVLK